LNYVEGNRSDIKQKLAHLGKIYNCPVLFERTLSLPESLSSATKKYLLALLFTGGSSLESRHLVGGAGKRPPRLRSVPMKPEHLVLAQCHLAAAARGSKRNPPQSVNRHCAFNNFQSYFMKSDSPFHPNLLPSSSNLRRATDKMHLK
jgi:hypothetical protein